MTDKYPTSSITYADDLLLVSDEITNMMMVLDKLDKTIAHLDTGVSTYSTSGFGY